MKYYYYNYQYKILKVPTVKIQSPLVAYRNLTQKGVSDIWTLGWLDFISFFWGGAVDLPV